MLTDMQGYSVALLLLVFLAHDPLRVSATYGWAQARTSLGRSLGDVIFEQPNSQGQQHKSDLRDTESKHNTPASKVRLWLDQDCGFTALLEGTQVFSKHGAVNGDFDVNFDEMILECNEEVPVYSFEGDDWSGTIPALEYGGFLPVGAAKMLPGYDGPNYGLARRDDEGGEYGTPSDCFTGRGSYRDTCAPGLWVTTQRPSIACLLCTACNPYDSQHSLTCTEAPSSCDDITNVQGQLICNHAPTDCQAAGSSCDSDNTCCSGLNCHASGGSGATCYGSS